MGEKRGGWKCFASEFVMYDKVGLDSGGTLRMTWRRWFFPYLETWR